MSADTTYLSTLRQALTFWEEGDLIDADLLRDDLDAAQVPENARGPMFNDAADKGYLERTSQFVRTQHPAGKGHLLRVYRVTGKAPGELADWLAENTWAEA